MSSPPSLLPFQVEPYNQLLTALTTQRRGRLLVMPAGCGKTFVFSLALAEAQRQGQLPPAGPLAACQILVITVAKAITQTNRVLARSGVKDFLVASHASLGRGFGDGLLTWTTTLRNNRLVESPTWDNDSKPAVIILDESQYVKNEDTIIAEIINSAVRQGILVICVSATPFTRPSETAVTNLSLGLISSIDDNYYFMRKFFVVGAAYDNYTPGTMREYNSYLVERGLKIEAHNIKFAHRVFNKCVLVDFESTQHRQIYESAYETYLKEMLEAGKLPPADARIRQWVANQKFWQASELIRVGQLVRAGTNILSSTNKQIITAFNYKDSLELAIKILTEVHEVPENKISIIKGGRNCQRDIDNFQYGRTDFCLLTLKAGGAGLSLHHEHKQARPRYCIIPPTYSAIQLVQLLGRAHRITSLSTTDQDCVWFRGTIEEDIAEKVQIKMGSLKEVVSRRETWLDLFLQKSKEEVKEMEEEFNKSLVAETEGEDGNIFLNSLPLEALSN